MSLRNEYPFGSTITAVGGAPLPEWAQFMLDLGRYSGRQDTEQPQNTTWRIVTVPHRNFAAGLFALGFLETKIPEIIRKVHENDVTKLEKGQLITWRRVDDLIACGTFIRFNSSESTKDIEYIPKSGGVTSKRSLEKVKEFNFSPYYGAPFTHHRAMSCNLDFFKGVFPTHYLDLLCNTVPTICLIGRPALWDDLRAVEFAIGGVSGCLDDLLRVSGDNENAAEDVSHFLTRFVSPDRDELEECSVSCAVFDGSRAYPKLKNFVSARQNLVVLDRWESGAFDSANAFAAAYEHAGAAVTQKLMGIQIPKTVEYAEWSTK